MKICEKDEFTLLWSQKADEGDRLVSGAGNMMSRFPFNQTPLYTSADEGMCSGISIVTQCWFLALRCVTSDTTTYFIMSFYEFKWEDRNEKAFCVLIEKVSVQRFACFLLNEKFEFKCNVFVWYVLVCSRARSGLSRTVISTVGACQRIHPAGIVSLIRGGHKGSGGPGVWVVNN